MSALILPKLGMCKNADEAIRELERMGARLCGSGHFSRVFKVEHYEHGPRALHFLDYQSVARMNPWEMMQPARMSAERVVRIIKVTKRRDSGALVVAKAAMATAEIDPLAPKYYGVTEFGGGAFMAEMEPLDKLSDMGHHTRMTGGNPDEPVYLQSRKPLDETVAASPFLSILSAYINKSGYTWDMHSDNVMMRGGQPVVTDPIYLSAEC